MFGSVRDLIYLGVSDSYLLIFFAGNNRGNKYSKKSIHHNPNSTKFWDFSIDDFAWHDIPDSIHYIIDTTGAKSVGYVGFSQGTAQAFAALSIHPKLNQKVNVFVALAPAMSPAGLAAPVVDGLMKASPTLVFLFFGRRAILSSTTMWQSSMCHQYSDPCHKELNITRSPIPANIHSSNRHGARFPFRLAQPQHPTTPETRRIRSPILLRFR